MFQNAKIAKEAGQAAEKQALADGTGASIARAAGRATEKVTLAKLDKWVTENVGRD